MTELAPGDRGTTARAAAARERFPLPADLIRNVAASTGLPEATAVRVVADVAAYFAESVEDYVRRRHRELHRARRRNDEIWPLIAAEIGSRRFAAPGLSERQMRRIVYGG